MSARSIPSDAYVVALARLPQVGPARLRSLLRAGEPSEVWESLCRVSFAESNPQRSSVVGKLMADGLDRLSQMQRTGLIELWGRAARSLDVATFWQAHLDAGIGVTVFGSPSFPPVFAADDDPPTVLFWKGDLDHLAGVRAAIVGTRRASRYGRDVAFELGRDLAASGVAVVSGLALGIDGAAHSGALEARGAPPIAVVGSGLDRVYPRAHAALWRRVVDAGVIISEYPLGAPAAAWQFPARNRLIATLADALIVVESQHTGGAMGTAVEATRRSGVVMAVPGPVTATSSDGTNQLLVDGCAPVRDATDVLIALGRDAIPRRTATESRRRPSSDAAAVLEHIGWQASPMEQLLLATGLDLGVLAVHLDALEADGWVSQRAGWVERIGRARS
jgi:DNA processing protein